MYGYLLKNEKCEIKEEGRKMEGSEQTMVRNTHSGDTLRNLIEH
jgi:hypothetical protein